MYLNRAQIKAVKVALDVMDIAIVYGEDTEEMKSAKAELEKLKENSKRLAEEKFDRNKTYLKIIDIIEAQG